jgi:hypothetical protein
MRCPDRRQPGSLFCRSHEHAPAAQRGGWLSAERRRRQLAASAEHALDASNVSPGFGDARGRGGKIWVGSQPPTDRDLPEFDVVALCAVEVQPELGAFHGRVLRCPIPDATLTIQQVSQALLTSKVIADDLVAQRRVLVTCYAGRNRAALVASLAIGRITNLSAEQLIELMRTRRHPDALSNPYFTYVLQRLVRDGRRRRIR